MSKIIIIGAGAMGSAFALPCIDNKHDVNIVGTHLENDFIDSLTGEQMRKIQVFFSSMPRLEHKIKVTNPNTKVESEVTLKGLTDFFG